MSGTTGIVTFVYATWAEMYPNIAGSVPLPQATQYFNMACGYCDNTACSPICDASPSGIRATILYLLTAHIATLFATINGVAPSPLVGRIATATQGSVSVGTQMSLPEAAEWFAQTPYGLAAWQMMLPYRLGFYQAPPQIPLAAQSYPRFLGGLGWTS